jgi:hypothetical protein
MLASMFRTLLTRRAGAPGTKRLLREHGDRLVCVRYRYDDEVGERLKTVELIVERLRLDRSPRRIRRQDGEDVVEIRVNRGEDLLRRAILLVGAKYDPETTRWRLSRATAASLGLTERIIRGRGRS